ncbi:hypothetical protein JOQ06_025344 [Pogonophryne albipinna]|uniref:Ig-like domain-containing protein n=1 Tax=Pogonophryne albipinna TaxID=1090488 RepID=A0AAD6AU41_9TELE|nr:hypothetical protein JOQ06_025344 [Pogonophryne albipinna]
MEKDRRLMIYCLLLAGGSGISPIIEAISFTTRMKQVSRKTSGDGQSCWDIWLIPPKPKLHHLKTAYQGRPYAVTCSVKHTCPYDPPKLTWSRATADVPNVVHKETHLGNWEVESILTIIPEEKDDHTDIT